MTPILILLYLLFRFSVNFPYWDEWEIPTLIQKIDTNKFSILDFFAQHNEHRLFFPRIIILFNFYLTRWNIKYELAFSFFLGICIFSFSVFYLKKIRNDISAASIFPYLPALSLLIFSLNQFDNWFIGWQLQIFLNIITVVLGIYFLTKDTTNPTRDFVLGIFCGIIATFSFANGLIFWFVGMIIIVLTKHFKKKLFTLSWFLISLFVLTLYFYHYVKPDNNPSLTAFTYSFFNFVQYVFVYIGGPLGVDDRTRALNFGIVNCIIFIYLIKRLAKIQIAILIPIIAIWCYAFLSALMTGIGRFGFGDKQIVSSRYITVANLSWISLYFLTYIYLENVINIKLKNCIFILIYLIIAIVSLVSLRFNLHLIIDHYNRVSYAKSQILCNKKIRNSVYELLYPNAKLVKTRITALKKYKLSFLNDKCFTFYPLYKNTLF